MAHLARRQDVRPGGDEGDAARRVVVAALAVGVVVAQVLAVVGDVQHQGVPAQIEALQGVQDPPHPAVDEADAGGVVGPHGAQQVRPRLVVRPLEAVLGAVVVGVAGDLVRRAHRQAEGQVGRAVEGVPGRRRVERGVGLDEARPEEEGLVAPLADVLLQVLDRAPPGPGGGVLRLRQLAHLGDVVHLVARPVGLLDVPPAGGEQVGQELVVRRREGDLLGEPQAVQAVRLPHRGEVHLAHRLPVVAPLPQQRRQGGQVRPQAVAVVEDPAAVGQASGEDRRPGGDADRGLGVGPGEAHPLAAEPVEVGRAQRGRRAVRAGAGGAGGADGVRPLLVGHQQQNVGALAAPGPAPGPLTRRPRRPGARRPRPGRRAADPPGPACAGRGR